MTFLWATKSEDVVLIIRAISFQDFQPMWSRSTNVTDRRQTTCDRKTALCTIVRRAVKMHTIARTYTHVCKSFPERAPHDSVDDRVNARVEARQNGQPANQAEVGEVTQVSDKHDQVCQAHRRPADGEDGGDRQAGKDQASRHRARCLTRTLHART